MTTWQKVGLGYLGVGALCYYAWTTPLFVQASNNPGVLAIPFWPYYWFVSSANWGISPFTALSENAGGPIVTQS